MPDLEVRLGTETRRLSCPPGQTLLDALLAAELPIRAACLGQGACGLCRVRISAGTAAPPTPIEQLHLDDEALAAGSRLACQMPATDDLVVEVPETGATQAWRLLDALELRHSHPASAPPAPAAAGGAPRSGTGPGTLGVAVDLGTSHVSALLCDLATGRWLLGCRGHNPQRVFGADILTRLAAAVASPADARRMRQQAIAAIGSALWHLAVGAGVPLARIGAVALVGNTAMLTLLSGQPAKALLEPRNWAATIAWQPPDTGDWAPTWGLLPETRIQVIPPLAGLIGSDLLAGVLATGLTGAAHGARLLIDFGTNSELALWDGAVLRCTSAAGGPAFECSGMRCGYPAEAGAILRVRFRGETPDYEVLGGGPARGLCGSGLVDLVAGLRRTGRLDNRGRFAAGVPLEGYAFGRGTDAQRRFVLCAADVDLLQRAKAAIGVGLVALLAHAGLGPGDLHRLCVGGTFGHGLDIGNAQALGLLPALPPGRVELCGNTALAGCALLLTQPARLKDLQVLIGSARVINLAHYQDFDGAFLEQLYLRPMSGEAAPR